MHPILSAILADETPFAVGPDTIAPAVELTASPVTRVAARAGLPRAYLWSQPPATVDGEAMRAHPTITVAITTSPVYQNSYIPPDHRYIETPWVHPGTNPISDADCTALGQKLGREMLHSLFAGGQHGDIYDGLVFPFGVGNVAFDAANAFLDVNPIFGHPSDAVQVGLYSETGQKKPASMGPGTESEVDRGRITPFTANSRAIGYKIAKACMAYIKANHLTYTPPGGGGPYELCIPDGFVFDVEEFIDRRLFHQDQYDGGWKRLSDIREFFLANRPDGTATTRATTEPIMYGPPNEDGEPTTWTLQEWWDDIIARGVWLGTTTLPLGENFAEGPLKELGKELEILASAITEFYLGETWVKAYEEEIGRTPRWGQYEAGYANDGTDAPADTLLYGRTRHPRVTFNYVRGWTDDTAEYGTAEALSTSERLDLLRAHLAQFDLTRPTVGEVPVPRDGESSSAGPGDADDIFEHLKCLHEHGIYEVVVWNNTTSAGKNKYVANFWPVWQRFLAWAALQAEEPGTGNVTNLIAGHFEDDAAAVAYADATPAVEPRGDVLIDDGIASALFLKMLTTNIAAITGAEGRGDIVRVETFSDQPKDNVARAARILTMDLDPLPRMRAGDTDAATMSVTIVCMVADTESAHASMEVASLVGKALDRKAILEREHRLHVLTIRRGYARPDDNKEIAYATLGVRVLVERIQNATIRPMGSGAAEAIAESGVE